MQEQKISWDEYFLNIAVAVSQRASCPRAKVGAVIVDRDHRIVSVGYNGAPSGSKECIEVGCEIINGHCVKAIHAEENAIYNAYDSGQYERLRGATMYTTLSCCPSCKQIAEHSMIRRFKSLMKYGDHL